MKKGHRVEYEDHAAELLLDGQRQGAFDVIRLRDVERSNVDRFYQAGALRFLQLRYHPLVPGIERDAQPRQRREEFLHQLDPLGGKIFVDAGYSGQILARTAEI